MKKRPSLLENLQGIAEKVNREPQAQTRNEPTTNGKMVITAVHIPEELLHLLRRVAVERAHKHGGRASVSSLITEIVQSTRQELEAELQ